jgi:retron-type reverse transcriptase/serine/threonine protein kinase
MSPENLFERMVTVDNLRNAWIKAKHHAQTEAVYFDAYAYDAFEEHLEANLAALYHEILNDTYHPAPLRYVTIPKGDQVRKLYFAEPRDSVVIQAVINVVGPLFEAEFSEYSFGNRLNIGDRESHDIYRRWQDQYSSYVSVVRGFLNEGPDAWYLITDIENFYPSIRLERLRGLIAAKVTDERILAIIELFLNLQAINLDEQLEPIEGLPAGAIYAHFFANIYLTEFDSLAVQCTRGYARYVDDLCLVCQGKDSLTATERCLGEYLGRWNQGFKATKTERHPVKEWGPLIDHTRKMKYTRRLDFIGTLDFSPGQIEAVSDAERLFRDLYLVVEKEGDIDKLVEDAGFVISRLKKLRAPNLDSVVYSLLETHPLKPSTLRVALSCLLEIELPNPSQRFQQYLVHRGDDRGYTRINLLQILPYFSQNAGELKRLLIEEFSQDPNYLVRANTYFALKILTERGAISLNIEELRHLRDTETSPYALKRLIDCYAMVSEDAIWLSLLSVIAPDSPEQVAAVARAFCQLLESKRIESTLLESVLPAFERIEALDVESYIHLLYLTSRFGAYWMISEILEKARQQINEVADRLFSIIALEVIQCFASGTQLGRLYQFADIVNRVGLRAEARLGFEEVISRTTDAELRQQAKARLDALKQVSISVGLPEWYDPTTCHRGLYRELRGDPEYLCLEFSSEAIQRAGTFELITAKRIQNSGFPNVEAWIKYLRRLDREGLISLIDAGSYEEDGLEKIFCLYEKPQGFQTLKEWLQHSNVKGLLPMSVVLEIGLSLVQAISKTKCDKFHLHSIDPLNVLWNPTGEIKLLNLGASLGISSYQCGVPECPVPSSRDEIGPSTATYHLGLLLLQLVRKECPLQAVNLTRARYGDRLTLPDLVDMPDIPPHFRLILVRMLQKVPDYRYSSLNCLEQDLRDAAAFTRLLSALRSKDGEDRTVWRTLQDFVTFRLKIISRNPELQNRPPIIQVHSMLGDLSGSLAFLPEVMLSTWQVYTRMRPQSAVFPSSFQARNLSPEGRRLLGIAEGWEETVTLRANRYIPTPLTKLCLYQTLAVEASACLVASVIASSGISQDTVAEMSKTVLDVMGELKGNHSATFTIRPPHQTSIAINVRFYSDELQQLQQFISWLRSDYTSYGKQVSSLKAAGLFLVLFGFGCEVLRNDQLIAWSKPVLYLNRAKLSGRSLWQLLKDLAVLDEEISHFQGTCLGESEESERLYVQQAAEAWTRIPETIDFIRRVNPSKRLAAELYAYHYWQRDGIVRLTFPHFKELSFSLSETFVSGGLMKERDAKRPIRVEVWSDKNTQKVCSVLAPSEYFKGLPLSERRISPSRIAVWMREHPFLRTLIFIAIGLATPSVIMSLLLLVGIEFSSGWVAIIASTAGALGGISSNLWASIVISFLATRYPEDAQLVE